MNKSLVGLCLLAFQGLSGFSEAAENDAKSAQDYRCLEPRECEFEQWFVSASIGHVSGDLTETDVLRDAAALGFEVFDIDIDDSRTAYKMGFGLHLATAWQAELGYVDLGEVSTAFSTNTTQPDDFLAQTNTIHPTTADGPYLSVQYNLINEVDWQLGMKAGVFFWDGDFESYEVFENREVENRSDADGTDLFYGIAVAYGLTEQLNIGVEFERYTFAEEHADLLSLGLRYYF